MVLLSQDVTERKEAEDAMQKSEARYRTLFEQAADGIFVVDAQGKYVDVNDAACQMLGYTRQELLELNVTDLIMSADLAATPLRLKQLLAGETMVFERQLKTKNGALLLVEISATKLVDEQILALVRDVTARKQADEMATRLGRILDASLNEIYIFDADTLRFTQVNQGAQENLGYSLTELQHLTPLDLKPEFTAKTFAQLIEPLFTGEKDKIHFETRHRRKDGSLYPVEVHLQQATFEASSVLIAIILDITERKQVEVQLRWNEARFRSFIKHAPDAIHLVDVATDTTEFLNRDSFCGYSKAELEAPGSVAHAIHPDDRAFVHQQWLQIIEGKLDRLEALEYRLQCKDESWEWIQARKGVVERDAQGRPNKILIFLTLITERKQAEAELRNHREHLADMVAERTTELRQMVNLMAGREVRMATLKEVVAQLRTQLLEAGLTPVSDDPLNPDDDMH